MVGRITPEMKYVVDLQVPSYGVDAQQRLKPSAFLDLAQEIAYLAAEAMHFGYDELSAGGTAWVLSRMTVRQLRAPLWRERITLQTWHKGPGGPFYLRDFALLSATGEPLVLATSSWVVLDTASRAMVRSSELLALVPDSTICPAHAIETPAGKVVIPRGLAPEATQEREVRYSDVDILGHTNNARYLLWALDALPYAPVAERPLRGFSVNFHHETRPGDTIRLARYADPDPDPGLTARYFVEALLGDRPAFTARIDF